MMYITDIEDDRPLRLENGMEGKTQLNFHLHV